MGIRGFCTGGLWFRDSFVDRYRRESTLIGDARRVPRPRSSHFRPLLAVRSKAIAYYALQTRHTTVRPRSARIAAVPKPPRLTRVPEAFRGSAEAPPGLAATAEASASSSRPPSLFLTQPSSSSFGHHR